MMVINICVFAIINFIDGRRLVDFIEEKGVVIVGEKSYHAALIEYRHLLFFYHNFKINESNVTFES
jgi:hypothetical protein